MPYIFRVIKVGQKADAPHGARLNTTWKNDKQKQIFEAVEDCILDTAKRLKAGEPVNADGLQALFDGVRIIHHKSSGKSPDSSTDDGVAIKM